MQLLKITSILCLSTLGLFAQDGTLDQSFGNNGIMTTSIGPNDDIAESMVIQDDGKILVAGRAQADPLFKFGIIRYNTDGSLDSSFGNQGIVGTSFGNSDDNAYAIALQNDQKILVAGQTFTSGSNLDFALARYNTDGSLDLEFGNSGAVITDINTPDDFARALCIQDDGKILLAGYGNDTEDNSFLLVRYNQNGSLDSSFGNEGIRQHTIGLLDQRNQTVALQNDGKIIIAGHAYNNVYSDYDFVLTRYLSDGSLDPSFGDNGQTITTISSGADEITSLIILEDNSILVGGHSFSFVGSTERDLVLAKYSPDGIIDNSFGEEGIVLTDFDEYDDLLFDIAIQNDGKILITGTSDPIFGGIEENDESSLILTRYHANGDIDNSFGSDGVTTTNFNAFTNIGTAIALQEDHKIVVAGYTFNGQNFDYAIARYNNNVTVSTQDVSSPIDIDISPNPTSDFLHIKTTLLPPLEITYELYDYQGKLLYTAKSKNNDHYINCQLLPQGNYVVVIKSGEYTLSRMIHKN